MFGIIGKGMSSIMIMQEHICNESTQVKMGAGVTYEDLTLTIDITDVELGGLARSLHHLIEVD